MCVLIVYMEKMQRSRAAGYARAVIRPFLQGQLNARLFLLASPCLDWTKPCGSSQQKQAGVNNPKLCCKLKNESSSQELREQQQ